jgi:hypothetical protein
MTGLKQAAYAERQLPEIVGLTDRIEYVDTWNATSEEIAWAAGLFEGEGHIGNRPYSDRLGTQRVLRLRMTDHDVVERFAVIVGGGTIYGPFVRGRWKPIWDWQCTRWEDIERILTAFRPLLGVRRGVAADELLANPARPVGGQRQEECGRGHDMSEGSPNVYTHPATGDRQCRTCKRVVKANFRARRKAARQRRGVE